MSADEEEAPQPVQGEARPRISPESADALWWLARWIALPLVVVIAAFYAEPLFRGEPKVEVVPTVLRQEVHPYPIPPDAKIAPLAPPEVPRAPRPSPITLPPFEFTAPQTPAEIAASPLAQPKPRYPERALNAEKEGLVRLRITIAPDGSVSDVVVVSAEPRGWFENAARDAVMRWRYHPSGGTISTEVEIEFKLD